MRMSPTYIIKKDDITQLVETMQETCDVFGPVKKRTTHVFAQLDDASLLDLSYDSTIMSPKKFFSPPREVMMRMNLEDISVEDVVQEIKSMKPRLLIGVHPCDINGILFMDRVFLRTYKDQYYKAYRDNMTTIGLNCLEPCKQGFCRSMNTSFVLEGYDMIFTEISDSLYYVHVGTPKGDRLLSKAPDLFKESSEEDQEAFKAALGRKHKNLVDKLNLDTIQETIDMSWDDEIWDELGEICMNCGACSLVCPTCYCFDVTDDVDLSLKQAERARKWDSCLFHDFALVAGNHNFRNQAAARLKFRFYHKMRGAIHEQGMVACVGCGRCTEACPAGISFEDVLTRLQEQWATAAPSGGL